MLAFPLSHRGTIQMAKAVTVEVDEKGRVHIPSSIRHELKSRRFTLSVKKGRLVMDPVKPATTDRGKYRGLLKASIEEVEEAQEQFVAADHRCEPAQPDPDRRRPPHLKSNCIQARHPLPESEGTETDQQGDKT